MGSLKNGNPDKVGIGVNDLLSIAITCAIVPLLSHLLNLVCGENDLWSTERLFALYFASFSGWILRECLQAEVARRGLKKKGYTFMDSDAAGNAVWVIPIMIALSCWHTTVGVLVLLVVYILAACLLWVHRSEVQIGMGQLCLVGVITVSGAAVVEFFYADTLVNFQLEKINLVIYIVFLILLIVLNILMDRLRIKWRKHREEVTARQSEDAAPED